MSRYLPAGTIFANRYRIEKRIASGGMGDVYEVVHVETNRRRALKVLHRTLLNNDAQRARFRKEARLAAAVESEYIVDVSDAGIDADTQMPFLVMELLRGEDLSARIARVGRLSAQETVDVLAQTAAALDKTHQAHIVHRDLKPDNLFLSEREHGPARVKLLDFGVAKIVAEGTQTGQATTGAVGTPLYMAPEQFAIGGTPSAATDIYALGLMAFTMLVGKPYWQQEAQNAAVSVAFAMKAVLGPQESASVRAAQYENVSLPAPFDAWFARATARTPTDRFTSAGEAVIELAKALDVPVPLSLSLVAPKNHAAPNEALERTRVLAAPKSTNTRIIIGAAASALLLLAAGVGYWLVASSSAVKTDAMPTSTPQPSPSPPAQRIDPIKSASPATNTSEPSIEATPVAEPSPSASPKVPMKPPAVVAPRTKDGDRRKHWTND